MFQTKSKQFQVSPIRKGSPVSSAPVAKVKSNIIAMKLGECFDISGLNKLEISNLRSQIFTFTKKEGIKVATRVKEGKLIVERIRK